MRRGLRLPWHLSGRLVVLQGLITPKASPPSANTPKNSTIHFLLAMLHFLCFSAFVDLGHGRRDYLGRLLGMIGWVDNGARFDNNPWVRLFSTVSNRLQMSTFNKGLSPAESSLPPSYALGTALFLRTSFVSERDRLLFCAKPGACHNFSVPEREEKYAACTARPSGFHRMNTLDSNFRSYKIMTGIA